MRNELSEYEGLILKGSRMVIPTTLRKRMTQILHTRGTMYWPNKNTDIENMIPNCTECEIYCNKLEKETLLQHNVPEMPLPKVATDLFHCFNQNYFILLDYTSKYFEVCQLQNLTREKVITKMKSSCSRFGVREEIVSDVIMGHNIHQGSFVNLLKYTTSDNTKSEEQYKKCNTKSEKEIEKSQTLLGRFILSITSPKINTKS